MDRRDFLKMGALGGIAGGLSALGGNVALPGSAVAAGKGDSAARDAMQALLAALDETQATHLSTLTDPDDIGEGQRAMAHILHTGLFFFLEADPERPVFKTYVTPTRKLLGDNPDSLYYFAPIRDDRSYRITGNVGGATFTSFTVEGGSSEGHAARASLAAVADDDMEIAEDGSFEITVSRKKPARGNWLELKKGAGQISTRHYHETKLSIAANDQAAMRIHIECLDPKPQKPYGGDAQVAARLGYVANFVREHAAMSLPPTQDRGIPWFSLTPNVHTAPGQWIGNADEGGYGNTHAWYASAFYELEPDEALLIEGRFPTCRFANVVLWNKFMQTYDFANRTISYNRQQISYQRDGSFRLVVAHEDPGVPNWLDTEGRPAGQIYWRYVLPVETPQAVKSTVVKRSSLS
jgi:hypothetical protein